MEIVLYLARHAQPDWSRTDISYYVPPGPPLTNPVPTAGAWEARRNGQGWELSLAFTP